MVDSSSARELEIEELLGNTNWLRELARSLVGDSFTAEDLMQEALAKAKREAQWATGHLGGWVAGIVRNLAKQHYRTESRRIAREQHAAYLKVQDLVPAEGADFAPDPAFLAQRVEMQKILAETLLALDEPSREILLLRFYGDRSAKQMAEQLDLSPRAVETRLRRAKLRLRERLEAKLGKGQWALACLPLLPKNLAPPPPVPPGSILPMAGLAAGVLLLFAVSFGWMPWQLGGDPSDPGHESQAVAAAEFHAAPIPVDGLNRETLPSPVTPEVLSERVLHLRFIEQGSGKSMPGLKLALYAVRLASAAEEEAGNDAHLLRTDGFTYWVLDRPTLSTDEAGNIAMGLPEDCTEVFLDLDLHTATHSVSNYARGLRRFHEYAIQAPLTTIEMAPRTGVATGRVIGPDGEGVPYAKVDLVPALTGVRAPSAARTVVADASGRFRMERVASNVGGFSLVPRLSGYLPIRQLYIASYKGPDRLFEGVELHLAASGPVRVVVQDDQGVPVVGAVVEAFAALDAQDLPAFPSGQYNSSWERSARTNELGIATVTATKVGGATWLVTCPGFSPWEASLAESAAVLPVTLRKGNDIRIQVLSHGSPVEDAAVRMVRKMDFASVEKGTLVNTDAQGRGVFEGAPVGEFVEFSVLAKGHQVFLSSPTMVLEGGQQLTVSLAPGLHISGHVVDWEKDYRGNALPKVFIQPIEAKGWIWDGEIPSAERQYSRLELAGVDQQDIDADGFFRFEGLAPGRYRLWFGKRLLPRGMLEANAGVEDLVLTSGLHEHLAPALQGVVRDAQTREPLPKYLLLLGTYSEDGERIKSNRGQLHEPSQRVEGGDGRFRLLTFRPGYYSLTVWAPNAGYASFETVPKYFAPGTHEFEFLVAKTGSLKLQIQNQSGEALEGVLVRALLPDGSKLKQAGKSTKSFLEWAKSFEEGEVEIGSIPESGDFQLEFLYQGKTTMRSGAALRDASHGLRMTVVL